jgi:DNA-binding HxlR family transcriptional regulator
MSQSYTPTSAAYDVEAALHLLEGRWKLVILFHLLGGKVLRFSDLERAIPTISQKMLGQQLRRLEADGIVVRTVYAQVPPRVEYRLTEWGQALCPALDAILTWAELRPQLTAGAIDAPARSMVDEPEKPSGVLPIPAPLPAS